MEQLIGQEARNILWWQMSIRGVIVFFFGLLLIRLFGRRAFGKETSLDIIVAIMVGSNLSRALTGNARLFPTLAATAVLFVIFYLVACLAARWPAVGRWIKGEPVHLIRDGHLDPAIAKRAGVSRGDLEEAARYSGMADLARVQEAVLEPSGKISVIPGPGTKP